MLNLIVPYAIITIAVVVGYKLLQYINRVPQPPQLSEGEWNPVVANYTWTSSNKHREEYERLSSLGSDPKLITQALMRRAMHDVKQAMDMNGQKQSLTSLVKSGLIGEDVLQRFNVAEQLLNADMGQVMQEAEAIKQGWGQSILQDAAKLLQIEQERERAIMQKQQSDHEQQMQHLQRTQSESAKQEQEDLQRQIADELIRQEELEKVNKNKRKNK